MNWRTVTKVVIGSTIVALVGYDIAMVVFTDRATLSSVITNSGYYSPILPFAFGVLMGHWFFPPAGKL